MDFHVNSPIMVTALGVFDSDGDGIGGSLRVAIFDISTMTTVTPILSFAGSDDPIIGGHRMRDLDIPVVLDVGDYSVVAQGFSASDRLGNQQCVDNSNPVCYPDALFTPSTTDTNGDLITFNRGLADVCPRRRRVRLDHSRVRQPGVAHADGAALHLR